MEINNENIQSIYNELIKEKKDLQEDIDYLERQLTSNGTSSEAAFEFRNDIRYAEERIDNIDEYLEEVSKYAKANNIVLVDQSRGVK